MQEFLDYIPFFGRRTEDGKRIPHLPFHFAMFGSFILLVCLFFYYLNEKGVFVSLIFVVAIMLCVAYYFYIVGNGVNYKRQKKEEKQKAEIAKNCEPIIEPEPEIETTNDGDTTEIDTPEETPEEEKPTLPDIVDNPLIIEIRKIINEFLNGLCSEEDRLWFENQVISITSINKDNIETTNEVKEISFKYDSEMKQPIKGYMVAYYAYKIDSLIKSKLDTKKANQEVIADLFFNTFKSNFKPKRDSFVQNLSGYHDKYEKYLRKKGLLSKTG
jgi:Ca2+/Na+ antiporter